MRHRYRELFREEIAQTVAGASMSRNRKRSGKRLEEQTNQSPRQNETCCGLAGMQSVLAEF